MADKKISALTASSTPLAGTEVLPIVQSGATVKVAVSDLTAGRDVATAALLSTKTSAGAVVDVATIQNLSSTAGTESALFFAPTSATGNIRGARISAVNDGANLVNLKFYTGSGASITSKFEMTYDGNLKVSTSGQGIDFSATPGTGTSELFSDYEEGTFTPVVTPGAGAITTQTGSGTYTKVGRQVTITLAVKVSNIGTASGSFTISLPYTAQTVSLGRASTSLVREDELVGQANQGWVISGSASLRVETLAGVNVTWVNNQGFTSTFTYFV
jgi:hypothetical protein